MMCNTCTDKVCTAATVATFAMSKVISTCLSLQKLVATTRAQVNVNRLVSLHGEFLLLCALVLGQHCCVCIVEIHRTHF